MPIALCEGFWAQSPHDQAKIGLEEMAHGWIAAKDGYDYPSENHYTTEFVDYFKRLADDFSNGWTGGVRFYREW
jgi:hypothetical protein